MLAVVVLVTTPALGFELKGLQPGMSFDAVQAAYPNMGCDRGDEKSAPNCHYARETARIIAKADERLDTLAERSVDRWTVEFAPGDKAALITVATDPPAFEGLRIALTEKFGKPTRTRVIQYHNAFGAAWQGRELTWTKGDDFARMTEYDGSRDTLSIALGKISLLGKLNDFSERAAKRRSNDL